MRTPVGAVLLLALALVGGCTNVVQDLAASNRELEEHQAANCRRWEERANIAAHPNAETIALHERLAKKAAELQAAAASLSGAALDAQIRKLAQAQIEADAVFDAEDKRKVAIECWQGLAMIREMHDQMMYRLGQDANQATSGQYLQGWTAPDPTVYTLHTQPPDAPPQNPVPYPVAAPASLPNADTVPQSPELGAFVGTVPGGPNVYVIPPGAGP